MSTDAFTKKRTLKYEKSLSRPKDANAPARPQTAYFAWASQNREKVKAEMSSSSITEITKKLGSMWRELPADEKMEWEEKSKAEMAVYQEKLLAYKETSNFDEFKKELLEYQVKMTYKPFGRDENMPKRPLSGYMLYSSEHRPRIAAENENMKITDVMVAVAKGWKELSDEGKKPYLDEAKKFSEEHAKRVAEYKESATHKKWLEDKKAYGERNAAKRRRLMKQLGMDVDGKGSGASPLSKRAKNKSEPKKEKKKSEPKKKKSVTKKKVSSPKKQKKKGSAKKRAEKAKKKKVSRKKKSKSSKSKKKSSKSKKSKSSNAKK